MLILLSSIRTFAVNIINRGLTNSIGWNLGKKNKSIHLFDPLISIPIKGTKKRKKIEIINKGIKIFKILSLLWREIKIKRDNEISTNKKCLIKKK